MSRSACSSSGYFQLQSLPNNASTSVSCPLSLPSSLIQQNPQPLSIQIRPLRYGAGSQVAIEQVKLAQLHALAAATLQDARCRGDQVIKLREIAREAENVLQWYGRTYEAALLRARWLAGGGEQRKA